MEKKKDFFASKAQDYEKEVARTSNVANIADAILSQINYTKEDTILDFGSGTGLLTEKIAPYVKKIVAVDMSESMTKVLRQKALGFDCELDIIQEDITTMNIKQKFNSIISSMTIHHVKDIKKLFVQFYDILEEGGTIALADLETEDGSFHSIDTGVFHFGFDKDEFLSIAKSVGFKELNIQTVSVAKKPYGDFPIFLLVGQK